MEKIWSTIEEAAPALRMSKQGLYDAIRKGQFPNKAVLRIGKRIRVNLKTLNDMTCEVADTQKGDMRDAA